MSKKLCGEAGVQLPESTRANERFKSARKVRGSQVQVSIRIPTEVRDRLNAIAGEQGFDSLAGLLVNQCNKLAKDGSAQI